MTPTARRDASGRPQGLVVRFRLLPPTTLTDVKQASSQSSNSGLWGSIYLRGQQPTGAFMWSPRSILQSLPQSDQRAQLGHEITNSRNLVTKSHSHWLAHKEWPSNHHQKQSGVNHHTSSEDDNHTS